MEKRKIWNIAELKRKKKVMNSWKKLNITKNVYRAEKEGKYLIVYIYEWKVIKEDGKLCKKAIRWLKKRNKRRGQYTAL